MASARKPRNSTKSNGKTKPRTPQKTTGASPAPKPPKSAHDYSIADVARTLDLLEALAVVGPASLAAVSEAAGCTRTAGFRLLRTLQSRGFAIQDEARGVWRLGARWSALGAAAESQGALAATALPFMKELANTSGDNVYLHVRDGQMGETVAISQADPNLRVYTAVGQRRPLHAGPYRLLLAHAPEAVQTQVLAQRLPRFTPATRTDPAWIAADLHRIRARGYLITADEVSPGVVSVTVPVRDATGQVIAALCVSAASLRMRPPRPRALVPVVTETAFRLSRALGRPADAHDPAPEQPAPALHLGSGVPVSGTSFHPRPPTQLGLT